MHRVIVFNSILRNHSIFFVNVFYSIFIYRTRTLKRARAYLTVLFIFFIYSLRMSICRWWFDKISQQNPFVWLILYCKFSVHMPLWITMHDPIPYRSSNCFLFFLYTFVHESKWRNIHLDFIWKHTKKYVVMDFPRDGLTSDR